MLLGFNTENEVFKSTPSMQRETSHTVCGLTNGSV